MIKQWLCFLCCLCCAFGSQSQGENSLCLPYEDCVVENSPSVEAKNTLNISLFQTTQEKQALIQANTKAQKNQEANQKKQDPPSSEAPLSTTVDLTITAILYTSPTLWSVWIGGRIYNQDQCDLEEVLGPGSTLRAKNAHVVEIIRGDKTKFMFLGQTLERDR